MDTLQIAKTAHAAHNVLHKNAGNEVVSWDNCSPDHKDVVINSVLKILSGEIGSPRQAHTNFVSLKKRTGWSFGENYSASLMTSPRLCDYDTLLETDRLKEELFFNIVASFKNL